MLMSSKKDIKQFQQSKKNIVHMTYWTLKLKKCLSERKFEVAMHYLGCEFKWLKFIASTVKTYQKRYQAIVAMLKIYYACDQ